MIVHPSHVDQVPTSKFEEKGVVGIRLLPEDEDAGEHDGFHRPSLQEEEIVSYILIGLGEEYDSFVTSMTHIDSVSLTDLYAHILSYELRNEQHTTEVHIASSANNVVKNNNGRNN